MNDNQNNNTTPESDTQEARYAITGMTCQACANRLEKVLNKNPSVDLAQVNFATETLNIRYHDADTQDIQAWIKKTGFEGRLIDDAPKPKQAPSMPWRLIALWALSLPFWVGMIGMMVGSHALMPPVWVQFVLASVVQFYFGWVFYKGAWASIRGGLANMDVLVALGTSAIWAYSTYMWLTSDHGGHGLVYFEASVMVIAFVSLGKYLEARTKQQSLNSLSMLMDLVPDTVQRKADDQWSAVSVKDIKVGDVLLARVGDRIGVDGVVTTGAGFTDEAHLTGESAALAKTAGDGVLAGSAVVDGGFEYRATATGGETALGDMVRALDEAQGTKADIARLADKVAGVFVPVVVGIALVVLFGNWAILGSFDEALMRAVSVLVIACPCALGLATPAAIMAGMGTAARYGVRFKDAPSLEMAGRIDTMVFDKTGTLTMGQPSIRATYLSDGVDGNDALGITASLEQHASHPLANALVKSALTQGLNLADVKNPTTVVGQGLMGEVAGVGMVKVGTPQFAGFDHFNEMIADPTNAKNVRYIGAHDANVWQIASIVAVSVNDIPLAAYALMDDIKENAKDAIDQLKQDGIDVIIMSGDHQGVVDDVAARLGITSAYGKLSPRDKAQRINELKQESRTVAMVGDGVNDAPAMAEAQVSFSVHDASSIAKHTSSAELVGDSVTHAQHAQHIALATLNNIKQNLFFAFVYNCIGIVAAAFGLLNPIIAAAAMALSSISVLMNALRLKRLKI